MCLRAQQQQQMVQSQWMMVHMSHLIGPTQQAVDTLPASDLNNYVKVRVAILHTLNLSHKAYRRWLRKIEFGPDYYPHLIGQKIQVASLWCLRPLTQTKEQIVEALMIEHYTTLLPFKPKNWVLCHNPSTLEKMIALMEAYASVKAGMYLINWSWKKKEEAHGSGAQQTAGVPSL